MRSMLLRKADEGCPASDDVSRWPASSRTRVTSTAPAVPKGASVQAGSALNACGIARVKEPIERSVAKRAPTAPNGA